MEHSKAPDRPSQKKVGAKLVVTCGDTSKMLQFVEERLDQVALSIQFLGQTLLLGLGRPGCRALDLA
jgi:hypothetical protein